MEVSVNLTDKALRDYELVCMARDNGDQRAYADLVGIYKEPLYYMLLKMTNNPTDADDLTIEAFGKAFKSLHQYTPNYAFSTWLFKIALNNCIDFIRKRRANLVSIDKVYQDSDAQETKMMFSDKDANPEEDIMKYQKNKMMREFVTRLKPHYRQLIELRYFNEYSYEEIAEELNLPIGTVKAQLFRARNFLYKIMKNIGEAL